MLCPKALRRSRLNPSVSLMVVKPWVMGLVCLLGFSSGRVSWWIRAKECHKVTMEQVSQKRFVGEGAIQRLSLSKAGGERQQAVKPLALQRGVAHELRENMPLVETVEMCRIWLCPRHSTQVRWIVPDFPLFTSCLLLSRATLTYGDLRVKKPSPLTNSPSK
jgi:hypothetical protein